MCLMFPNTPRIIVLTRMHAACLMIHTPLNDPYVILFFEIVSSKQALGSRPTQI